MALQSEVERQFYLGMAGVSCWYARSTLTGAAPSPDLDFGAVSEPIPDPVPDPVLEPASRQRPSGQDRRQSLAAIQGLVSTPGARAAAIEPDARPEPVPEPPVAPQAGLEPAPQDATPARAESGSDDVSASAATGVAEAHWGLWFSEQFVLISALSSDASIRLQDALANNILQALGQTVVEQQTLQWPVFNNPAVPGNDEAGLQAVLRELALQFNQRRLLTLGLLPELPVDARSAWLGSVLGQPAVEFPFGLAALSADPDRKRQLWTRLRPLAGSDQ